jgi:hypothetical protein
MVTYFSKKSGYFKSSNLALPIKDELLHRGADRLIGTMNTAIPTTGSPLTLFKLSPHPFDVLRSGFGFLHRDHPAYPFIASKGRKVIPFCKRFRIRSERLAQIRRQLVYNARGDFFFSHK